MKWYRSKAYTKRCQHRDSGHFVSCEMVELLANPDDSDFTTLDGNTIISRRLLKEFERINSKLESTDG